MTQKVTCYDNRELSWLKFNGRVLEEAENTTVPLLERLKFCAIFQSNLDEFFRVRVGTLYTKERTEPDRKDSKGGLTAKQQRHAVFEVVRNLEPQRDAAFHAVLQELSRYGLARVTYDTATAAERRILDNYYKRELRPLLTPMYTGRGQSFPFLKNGTIYVAARLESKSGGMHLGLLPVDEQLRRMIPLDAQGKRFMLVEDLLLALAPTVFKGNQVIDKTLLRITRSADMREFQEEHDNDFRLWMEDQMKRRWKLAPVRMQLSESLNPTALDYLRRQLGLRESQIFYAKAPLDLSFVYSLEDVLSEPSLRYPKRIPQKPTCVTENQPIIPQLLRRDMLLSYPFESIRPFIRLLQEAAEDRNVMAISITLYRVAKHSQVIEALCNAAENGKRVLVVIELRARFDEENNIEWSRALQKAGCTVLYGTPNYKVHSKLLLITRKSAGGVSYITQVGTGNYNEKTAQIYTDLTLMTANPAIGAEAKAVFDALCTDSFIEENGVLLVSPHTLKNQVLEMLDEEIAHAAAGEPAYAGFKMNSLTDMDIMKKLEEASCAGVKIDLVVRGVCSLIAGVAGRTENVTVRSIVGRYLEHNRIYFFGTEARLRVYLGSADFMTRNTTRRVEVAVPVYDTAIRERLLRLFRLYLADNTKARVMQPDGSYVLAVPQGKPVNAQEQLFDEAYRKAEQKEARIAAKQKTTVTEEASVLLPPAEKKPSRTQKAKPEADTASKRKPGRPAKNAQSEKTETSTDAAIQAQEKPKRTKKAKPEADTASKRKPGRPAKSAQSEKAETTADAAIQAQEKPKRTRTTKKKQNPEQDS